MLLITQFDMVLVDRLIPMYLNAFDCLFRGNAFTYLPFMIEATKAEVAMLLQNKSTGCSVLKIVLLLFFEV